MHILFEMLLLQPAVTTTLMNTMINTCLHRHSVLLQLFEMVLGFVSLYQPFCTLAINTVGVLMLTKNIFCL